MHGTMSVLKATSLAPKAGHQADHERREGLDPNLGQHHAPTQKWRAPSRHVGGTWC